MRYTQTAARGRIAAMNPDPITFGGYKRIVVAFQHNILIRPIRVSVVSRAAEIPPIVSARRVTVADAFIRVGLRTPQTGDIHELRATGIIKAKVTGSGSGIQIDLDSPTAGKGIRIRPDTGSKQAAAIRAVYQDFSIHITRVGHSHREGFRSGGAPSRDGKAAFCLFVIGSILAV